MTEKYYENENTKIKQWYIKEYPADELGKEISDDITFYDLFYALDTYQNIYKKLNVCDSFIRERVFVKLAEIMQTDYDYIYEQYLLCK